MVEEDKDRLPDDPRVMVLEAGLRDVCNFCDVKAWGSARVLAGELGDYPWRAMVIESEFPRLKLVLGEGVDQATLVFSNDCIAVNAGGLYFVYNGSLKGFDNHDSARLGTILRTLGHESPQISIFCNPDHGNKFEVWINQKPQQRLTPVDFL